MRLTLGTTYYNCPDLLEKFIDHNIDHFDEIIVVDDGSTEQAEHYIKNRQKIRLYRVPIDYGFNSHGCRNLIMKETNTDWNVLLDVDRLFVDTKLAVDTIKSKKLRADTLYLFEMFSNHKKPETIHPSVNDFLVNKNHFWKAGGYDEELIGIRFGDREYRKQLLHFGKEQLMYGIQAKFTRGPSNMINFVSPNDIKEYDLKLNNLINERMIRPEPNKKTLTFEWYRVF